MAELPIARPLPPGWTPERVFDVLASRRGCLWLDSSSGDLGISGRYSFLSCDPVRFVTASPGDPDPWPQLSGLARGLPATHHPGLPPFQGGLAGLIGYEAATWLEAVPVARDNDHPTAAVAIGLYDWTIAFDHHIGEGWLISQGLGCGDRGERQRRAAERCDEVFGWLAAAETGKPPRSSNGAVERAAGGQRVELDQLRSNFTGEGFRQAVGEIIRRIRRGDSFQVNLAQRLIHPAVAPSPALYRQLRHCNPAPFAGYFDAGDFQVLSSSPEGFVNVRGDLVETRPIKGTIPRTGDSRRDEELAGRLLTSEKDRAENVMIVDLMRNDLSRVCEDDSIVVSQLCEIERYQHVQHLVSAVQGRLRPDRHVIDLLAACFPGGSVTGAPKIEAMRTIAELEPNPRGPYCGSLGYLSCGGDADFNILIRTITAGDGVWQIPVGGGITARSDPAAEEAETWTKAQGMLRAVQRVCQQVRRVRLDQGN